MRSTYTVSLVFFFFFSSRRRHTRCSRDWSSDVCSSDLLGVDPEPLTAQDTDRRRRIEQALEPSPFVPERPAGGQDLQVQAGGEPNLHVRERLTQVTDDPRRDIQGELVDLEPLTEHTVVCEARANDLEVFGCVQRRSEE